MHTPNDIIRAIEELAPEEREEVISHFRSRHNAMVDAVARLRAAGVEVQAPKERTAPREPFTPITLGGEPLSEQITRERR